MSRLPDISRLSPPTRLMRPLAFGLLVAAFLAALFVAATNTPAASAAAPTCNGLAATIIGTDDDDDLPGTEGVDVIAGLGGDDNIDGLGGNDVLCGGSGNDRVQGGDGNDFIDGGSGKDKLYGELGYDRVYGGEGSDRVEGNAGPDRLYGGPDDDVIDGGPGRDKLYGEDGNDTLLGLGGADELVGSNGDDFLDGGLDDDADTLKGGADADYCINGEIVTTCEYPLLTTKEVAAAVVNYSYSPDPDATFPDLSAGGVLTITARFANGSNSSGYADIFLAVKTLDGEGCPCALLNADGVPGGVGAKLTVPNTDLGPDGVLAPGELTANQVFRVGLTVQTPITFFVDSYGRPVDLTPAQ